MTKIKDNHFTNFTTVLYPDSPEDVARMDILFSPECVDIFKLVYILHDRDRWVQAEVDEYNERKASGESVSSVVPVVGELKKPHYHLLMSSVCSTGTTLSGFCKRVDIPVNRVQPVSDSYGVLFYMPHRDPYSRRVGKFVYEVSDLKGYLPRIRKVFSKRSNNYIQLREYAEMIDQGCDLSEITEYLSSLPDSSDTLPYDVFEKYQYFIVAMANQWDRRYLHKIPSSDS